MRGSTLGSYTRLQMANEIEVKFLIADLPGLARKLRQAGFRLQTPRTHESNTLFDTRMKSLRRRGELLRIRKYGDQWTLTHKSKGAAGRHKRRIETETMLADGQALAAIFERLGMRPSFAYEKFRTEYTDGEGHVVVDETPIGNVAEIEGPARWIDKTARALGITPAQYITKSYAELFADWRKSTRSRASEMTFRACAPRLGSPSRSSRQ
jgi:adenylate cyclase, class 2